MMESQVCLLAIQSGCIPGRLSVYSAKSHSRTIRKAHSLWMESWNAGSALQRHFSQSLYAGRSGPAVAANLQSSRLVRFFSALVFSYGMVLSHALQAEVFSPDVIGTEQEERAPDSLDFRLAINPGVAIRAEDLKIKRNQTDTVESVAELDGGAEVSWHVDLTTTDLRLSDNVGFHLIGWAGSMRFEKQVIKKINAEGKEDRVSTDLGTRMTGYYTLVAPVFYIGSKSRYDGLRLGVGYGAQSFRFSGNFLFRDEDERVLLFSETSLDRFDFVRSLRETTLLSSGFNLTGGDPWASLLILNLTQPEGLANYGRYILFRDGFSLRGNNLFLLNYLTRGPPSGKLRLSFEEAYGAISLGRNNINLRRRAAGTGFVFLSWGTDSLCPTEACVFQATYGGTLFQERELDFDFRVFQFTYSFRLKIL